MQNARLLISNELHALYPAEEIESLTSILLENVLNFTRTELFLKSDFVIDIEGNNRIIAIVERLKNFEPIQYILGEAEFYGTKFVVSPGVLIPRQETEELVDLIINENRQVGLKIVDIGTGSGCIAISLKKNLNQAEVTAIDVSEDALRIAAQNATKERLNIEFQRCSILNEAIFRISEKFDIIVSNPPYICEKEKVAMHKNVLDYEPELALFVPDTDPLLFFRMIGEFGKKHLSDSGKIYVEINEAYGIETARLYKDQGFSNIRIIKDINNKDRIVFASIK